MAFHPPGEQAQQSNGEKKPSQEEKQGRPQQAAQEGLPQVQRALYRQHSQAVLLERQGKRGAGNPLRSEIDAAHSHIHLVVPGGLQEGTKGGPIFQDERKFLFGRHPVPEIHRQPFPDTFFAKGAGMGSIDHPHSQYTPPGLGPGCRAGEANQERGHDYSHSSGDGVHQEPTLHHVTVLLCG